MLISVYERKIPTHLIYDKQTRFNCNKLLRGNYYWKSWECLIYKQEDVIEFRRNEERKLHLRFINASRRAYILQTRQVLSFYDYIIAIIWWCVLIIYAIWMYECRKRRSKNQIKAQSLHIHMSAECTKLNIYEFKGVYCGRLSNIREERNYFACKRYVPKLPGFRQSNPFYHIYTQFISILSSILILLSPSHSLF